VNKFKDLLTIDVQSKFDGSGGKLEDVIGSGGGSDQR
jgi:hypothetical protein